MGLVKTVLTGKCIPENVYIQINKKDVKSIT
jgi:hypothetical protein